MKKNHPNLDAIEKLIEELENRDESLIETTEREDFMDLLNQLSNLGNFSEDSFERMINLSQRLNNLILRAEKELVELKNKVENTKKSTIAHSSYINADALGKDKNSPKNGNRKD